MDPRMNTSPNDKTPSARVTLTDPHVRALAPSETAKDIWDSQQPGLMVRVLPSGRKEFAIRYRIHGRRRRLKLGVYPSVTLQEARVRALRAAKLSRTIGLD